MSMLQSTGVSTVGAPLDVGAFDAVASVGDEEGLSVGALLAAVGGAESATDGLSVGVAVGMLLKLSIVGRAESCVVGETVVEGLADGISVNPTDGLSVGVLLTMSIVGRAESVVVGETEIDSEGASVGGLLTVVGVLLAAVSRVGTAETIEDGAMEGAPVAIVPDGELEGKSVAMDGLALGTVVGAQLGSLLTWTEGAFEATTFAVSEGAADGSILRLSGPRKRFQKIKSSSTAWAVEETRSHNPRARILIRFVR